MLRQSVLRALSARAPQPIFSLPSLHAVRFMASATEPLTERPAASTPGNAAPPKPKPPVQRVVDTPLPDVLGQRRKQRIYFGIFCAVMALSLFGMVKYEAANSPIVTSTLFALRRSDAVLAHLGRNIRFTSTMPWVSGSAGIAKDVVDFSYNIVGDNGSATVHFRSEKVKGENRYVVADWSITPHQGPHKDEPVSLVEEDFLPHIPLSNNDEPGVVRNPRN